MAPKFYAVRVGRKPGIYSSWDSCKEQVERFQQAKCQSTGYSSIVGASY